MIGLSEMAESFPLNIRTVNSNGDPYLLHYREKKTQELEKRIQDKFDILKQHIKNPCVLPKVCLFGEDADFTMLQKIVTCKTFIILPIVDENGNGVTHIYTIGCWYYWNIPEIVITFDTNSLEITASFAHTIMSIIHNYVFKNYKKCVMDEHGRFKKNIDKSYVNESDTYQVSEFGDDFTLTLEAMKEEDYRTDGLNITLMNWFYELWTNNENTQELLPLVKDSKEIETPEFQNKLLNWYREWNDVENRKNYDYPIVRVALSARDVECIKNGLADTLAKQFIDKLTSQDFIRGATRNSIDRINRSDMDRIDRIERLEDINDINDLAGLSALSSLSNLGELTGMNTGYNNTGGVNMRSFTTNLDTDSDDANSEDISRRLRNYDKDYDDLNSDDTFDSLDELNRLGDLEYEAEQRRLQEEAEAQARAAAAADATATKGKGKGKGRGKGKGKSATAKASSVKVKSKVSENFEPKKRGRPSKESKANAAK